jgi:hypothetical protein
MAIGVFMSAGSPALTPPLLANGKPALNGPHAILEDAPAQGPFCEASALQRVDVAILPSPILFRMVMVNPNYVPGAAQK